MNPTTLDAFSTSAPHEIVNTSILPFTVAKVVTWVRSHGFLTQDISYASGVRDTRSISKVTHGTDYWNDGMHVVDCYPNRTSSQFLQTQVWNGTVNGEIIFICILCFLIFFFFLQNKWMFYTLCCVFFASRAPCTNILFRSSCVMLPALTEAPTHAVSILL